MKHVLRTLIVAAFISAGLFLLMPVSSAAAEKTAEEKQLEELTAYLQAITEAGASEADIAFTKQCIETLKAQITLNEQKAAEAAKAAELQKAAEEALKAASSAPKAVAGIIFVGDSRFVELNNALNNLFGGTPITIIAENSKGYKWFVENAIPRIDAITGKGTRIVINLGVNDVGDIDRYIETVNLKAAEWTAKGAKVYYATVNPVWENQYVSEDKVAYFNNRLKTELIGVTVIDTHDYLVSTGYKLRDGLHYDTPTTLLIFQYIMGNLK
ncbi:MAG: SGNH/GDSL hydrolase family protein [Lachnospiraceae bacterium]|nr:SGNH/GDSL hydrolase family protein [Lachnospiraceae bacterium]